MLLAKTNINLKRQVRFAISLTIICTIIGFALYFQIMKTLVFLKYPDNYIEQHGKYPVFGTSGMSSTYGWCATAQIWMMYVPTFLGIIFLSMGTRAAYCYPYASAVDQGKGEKEMLERENSTKVRPPPQMKVARARWTASIAPEFFFVLKRT